jgi:hypothetical protein
MRQFKPGQLQTGSIYPISASYALTASYVSGSVSIDTGSLVTTASFFAYTASQSLVSQSFDSRINSLTGSINTLTSSYNSFTSSYTTGSFTGSFTGTLNGTASWATNSVTASFITASNVIGTVTSASYAISASHLIGGVTIDTGSFATTGSNIFIGDQTISGSVTVTGSGVNLETDSFTIHSPAVNTNLLAASNTKGVTISDTSDVESIDAENRQLSDENGSSAILWDTQRTLNSTNGTVLDWETQLLKDYNGKQSADWHTRYLKDTGELTSIDWNNRQLLNSNSNVIVDWGLGTFSGTADTASFVTASNVVGTVTSASYAESASHLIGGTGSFVTTASFNAFTASYTTGSFTGSFTGTLNGTASWATNSVTASFVTASNVYGIVASASYAETASYVQNAQTASYVLQAVSASYANTASYVTPLSQQIILSGSLKLDPTQDPDPTGLDLDSTVLFQSSSNTALGYDLYVRQNGNLVKWKWIEGILETGLLYGGVVTYSGSDVFVSPGSGIIADHNATTGSEVSPMIEYVTWNAITQSITNIATQQVTYLYIDNTGTLQQQSTRFTSQQYHDYIPLGAVGHFDYTHVSAFGGSVKTAYDQISQISNFLDAFGPLKMSGYGLTGQPGSLRLSVGSGTSFIHGGFYQNNPEFPSQTTTSTQATASMVRVQRSGSVITFDTNNGNLYTVVDPTKYDETGDGTLANMGAGNWSIQRVFTDPKTGVLYVYYGQAKYTSLLNALQYLPTDPFTEGDTFDFTTFVGYLVLKGNASDITDTAANSILNGGLFRGSGQGSGGGIALSNLDDLTDVSIVSPTNGQALIYDDDIWKNGTPKTAETASFVTASNVVGTVTSASYAVSASFLQGLDLGLYTTTSSFNSFTSSIQGQVNSLTAATSSYMLTSATASMLAPYVLTSQTASMTVLSASFANTASFVTASNVVGTVVSASYALTASYAMNGGGGAGTTYIRRSDYTSSLDPNVNYLYLGDAEAGSSESANVWDISRLSISSSGATLTQTTSSAAWTDRYTVTYL